MAQRVTYRRRTSFRTTSNKTHVVKTPGGKLNVQYNVKAGTRPRCGDCGIVLPGIPALRPTEFMRISKRQKTITRAYGGSRFFSAVFVFQL